MSWFAKLAVVGLVLILGVVIWWQDDKSVMRTKNDPPPINLNPIGQPGPINDPANAPGNLNVTSPNYGCVRGVGNKNGCMHFAATEFGDITFNITGNPNPSTCADNATRVISQIKLTATAGPDPQPSNKGDFSLTNYPLDSRFETEGFPALDITTGIVYEETNSNPGVTRVVIQNLNGNGTVNPTGVDIWYEVIVKRCNPLPHLPANYLYWKTDPRIENEGMN